MANYLITFTCRLSWNLGASTSWNLQGLSRPLMGWLYLYLHHLMSDGINNLGEYEIFVEILPWISEREVPIVVIRCKLRITFKWILNKHMAYEFILSGLGLIQWGNVVGSTLKGASILWCQWTRRVDITFVLNTLLWYYMKYNAFNRQSQQKLFIKRVEITITVDTTKL